MYVVIVALTTLILPVGSVLLAAGANPAADFTGLVGLWFVVWGVGVRLGLAGASQVLRPDATARGIFGLKGDGALAIVRELGFANLAIGIVGLLTLLHPAFVLPAAIYATLFYAAAGLLHLHQTERGLNETAAMLSDLFMAAALGGFIAASLI
jgi:hypothetical protein